MSCAEKMRGRDLTSTLKTVTITVLLYSVEVLETDLAYHLKKGVTSGKSRVFFLQSIASPNWFLVLNVLFPRADHAIIG